MKPPGNEPGHEGEPPKCGAKTRAGGGCRNTAGYKTGHPGTGRCAFHAGATPTHERAATTEIARRECARLGIPVEADPGEALLGELWETAGNVAFYRELVQQLSTHPEPDMFISDDSENGGHWQRGKPGVYGPTYHVSGIPTGEAKPHVLVQLYAHERRHLVDVASVALRAGVEDRRVRIAERDGELIARALRGILSDLGVADRPDAGKVVRRHLELVAATGEHGERVIGVSTEPRTTAP
jgi:hypothetical protein